MHATANATDNTAAGVSRLSACTDCHCDGFSAHTPMPSGRADYKCNSYYVDDGNGPVCARYGHKLHTQRSGSQFLVLPLHPSSSILAGDSSVHGEEGGCLVLVPPVSGWSAAGGGRCSSRVLSILKPSDGADVVRLGC